MPSLEEREAVAEAAQWLDDHWPTEEIGEPWYEVIDFSMIRMSDPCRCVCGQLGARLAAHEGYEVEPWGAIVLEGGRSTSGYGILDCQVDGFSNERDRELARELARFLAKRLGVERFDAITNQQIIPKHLDDAFIHPSSAVLWLVEVRKRQAACPDTSR